MFIYFCFGKHFVEARSEDYVMMSIWTDYSDEV